MTKPNRPIIEGFFYVEVSPTSYLICEYTGTEHRKLTQVAALRSRAQAKRLVDKLNEEEMVK